MAAYNNKTSSKKLDFNNTDYVSIKEILCNTDWDSLLIGDTQESWNAFKKLLNSLETKYVPENTYSVNVRKKPIWITHKAMKLIATKRKVYAKFIDHLHPVVMKIQQNDYEDGT